MTNAESLFVSRQGDASAEAIFHLAAPAALLLRPFSRCLQAAVGSENSGGGPGPSDSRLAREARSARLWGRL